MKRKPAPARLRSESSLFVCLKPDTKNVLRRVAAADNRTMSQYASLLIEQELQRRAA